MSPSIHPSINEYIVDAYKCDGKFLANKLVREQTQTNWTLQGKLTLSDYSCSENKAGHSIKNRISLTAAKSSKYSRLPKPAQKLVVMYFELSHC